VELIHLCILRDEKLTPPGDPVILDGRGEALREEKVKGFALSSRPHLDDDEEDDGCPGTRESKPIVILYELSGKEKGRVKEQASRDARSSSPTLPLAGMQVDRNPNWPYGQTPTTSGPVPSVYATIQSESRLGRSNSTQTSSSGSQYSHSNSDRRHSAISPISPLSPKTPEGDEALGGVNDWVAATGGGGKVPIPTKYNTRRKATRNSCQLFSFPSPSPF
jgi:hypothetical protein